MRKPNPEDYEPGYTPPGKHPTPEAVDLSDAVPIKAKPEQQPPPTPAKELAQSSPATENISSGERTQNRPEEHPEIRSEFRTEDRAPARPLALPIKRRTKRYSFEFYEDQLVKLKQLKIQAELAGQGLSLSDMVRTAMDDYLHDKTID